MPSDAGVSLSQILFHLDLIDLWTSGLDEATFSSDLKTFYAVTRCLEIVSEASRRLPPEIKMRHSQIDWRTMAAAGNFYRHQYEDVAAHRVWHTTRHNLLPLRNAMEQEIARLNGSGGAR